MYEAVRFPTVRELFLRKLPMAQCVWVTECTSVVDDRMYEWEMLVPVP